MLEGKRTHTCWVLSCPNAIRVPVVPTSLLPGRSDGLASLMLLSGAQISMFPTRKLGAQIIFIGYVWYSLIKVSHKNSSKWISYYFIFILKNTSLNYPLYRGPNFYNYFWIILNTFSPGGQGGEWSPCISRATTSVQHRHDCRNC